MYSECSTKRPSLSDESFGDCQSVSTFTATDTIKRTVRAIIPIENSHEMLSFSSNWHPN